MAKVRLKYSKQGNLKYISHLDLLRTINRALRRAGLNVALTQGFNPHYNISFSDPLPIYVESESEYMDVVFEKFNTDMNMVLSKLNDAMPDGLCMLSAQHIGTLDPKLSTLNNECKYEAEIDCDIKEIEQNIKNMQEQDVCVTIIRKNKARVIHIKDYVSDISVEKIKAKKEVALKYTLKKKETGAIVSPVIFVKGLIGYNDKQELGIKIIKR